MDSETWSAPSNSEVETADVLVLEEADGALVLPVWEPTGESRVDDALELLHSLNPDDVSDHAGVYSEVHDRLRGALTDLDAG